MQKDYIDKYRIYIKDKRMRKESDQVRLQMKTKNVGGNLARKNILC